MPAHRDPSDDTADLEAYLPLRPIDFHVLLVLTHGDLHGYAMVREVDRSSDGRIRLEPGNLYRYLRGLSERKLVEAVGRRASSEADDERRRYYRITELGRRVLAAEAARMRRLAAEAARQVVLPDAAGP